MTNQPSLRRIWALVAGTALAAGMLTGTLPSALAQPDPEVSSQATSPDSEDVVSTNGPETANDTVESSDTQALPTPAPTATWDPTTATATVSWAPYDWSGLTPGSFLAQYKYSTQPSTSWTTINTSDPLALSAGVGINVGDNFTVDFRVYAQAQDGTTSLPGTTSVAAPNPGVPLTVQTADAQGEITWAPVSGATRYVLLWQKYVAPPAPSGTEIVTCTNAPCSYTLSGLDNGAEYRAHVNAMAPNGKVIAFTDPSVSFTPNPPAPTPLPEPLPAIAWIGDKTTAQIDWAPYNWGAATPLRFEISWTTNSGALWNPVNNTNSPLATTATIPGLPPGSTARFRIRAVPASGNPSDYGTVFSLVPMPPVAFSLTAAPGDQEAILTWNRLPQSGLTYKIEGFGLPTPVVPIQVTCPDTQTTCTYRMTGLTNGTTYTYEVVAETSTTVNRTNRVTVTPTAPATPLNVVYPVSVNLEVGRSVIIDPDAAFSSGNPNSFTEGKPALPSGLYLDTTTGEITGTPTSTADGLFPINVSNAQGQSLTVPLRLRISPHTLTLTYSDHSGHVGSAMTMSPHTSNVIFAVYNFTITQGTLPTGLSLDSSSGVISGSPTQVTSGPAVITVRASDRYAFATSTFTITVDGGAAQLSVSYPNAVAHVGKAQGITPTVSGASGSLTFTITSGSLPAGMTLDAGLGVITGTPTTAAGPTPVTVEVTDGTATDDVTFTIEVLAHSLSLAFPSSARDIGIPTRLSPVISHVEGTVSFALTSGILPAGLALDPATGVISGTPTATTGGPIALTMTATDSYASATAPFTLEITDPSAPVPQVSVALNRNLERVTVIGSVATVPAGTLVTPMVRLFGQSVFQAGLPVQVNADGAFTWTRKVSLDRDIEVYFTVGSGRSQELYAAEPSVSVGGDRMGGRVTVTGTTTSVAAGTRVVPWVRIDGGRAVRGVPVQIGVDGSFTWTRRIANERAFTVKFNIAGLKSWQLSL